MGRRATPSRARTTVETAQRTAGPRTHPKHPARESSSNPSSGESGRAQKNRKTLLLLLPYCTNTGIIISRHSYYSLSRWTLKPVDPRFACLLSGRCGRRCHSSAAQEGSWSAGMRSPFRSGRGERAGGGAEGSLLALLLWVGVGRGIGRVCAEGRRVRLLLWHVFGWLVFGSDGGSIDTWTAGGGERVRSVALVAVCDRNGGVRAWWMGSDVSRSYLLCDAFTQQGIYLRRGAARRGIPTHRM